MSYQVHAYYHVEYSYETKVHTHFREDPTCVKVFDENNKLVVYASFVSNRANGGRNETGIKRYTKLLKKAAKEGATVQIGVINAINQYETMERFHEAIGI